MEDVKEILKQCIDINNAYKKKHEELKMVYKAYTELYPKTNSECLLLNIIKTMHDITKLHNCNQEIFSKKEFYKMLKTQSKIMCEVKNINREINKHYPNI